MSAARTEKSRLSDTSFNAGVNPVLDKKAYLEEKAQPGQVPPRKQLWPGNYRHSRAGGNPMESATASSLDPRLRGDDKFGHFRGPVIRPPAG